MDREKIVKKINNLKKVKGIIEVAKIDTLQKLAKSANISDHHYEIANTSRNILKFGTKFLTNVKIKEKISNSKPKLFIYISIPSTLIKVSYDTLNKKIDQVINPKLDEIIAIGEPAFEYAKKRKIKVLKYFDNLDNTSEQLTTMISHFISKSIHSKILLFSKTPKLKNKPLIIFPLDTKQEDIKKMKKLKFYPSLSSNFADISNTYIYNIVHSIYMETYKMFYKEKLLKHEESIKTIKAKADLLKQDLNKDSRKAETEEMIQVIQIAKRK